VFNHPRFREVLTGRYELLARDDMWAELERRGTTIATVPFR